MRLTVGPLPAAVYWRRRAVVLVGLAMVVLVISYACGGPDSSTAGVGGRGTNGPGEGSPAVETTLLTPMAPARPSPTPGASAFTLPTTGGSGACADAELSVTASAAAAQVPIGQTVDLTIKIRNISARTCSRDIGADLQELRVLDQGKIIWSSDDCGANKGKDVRSFTPGKELSFTLTWDVVRTRNGTGSVICTPGAPHPDPRVYDLVARLDQILSVPFALRVV